MSDTGTYAPSIWQKELPNCSFAMSLRPGNWAQPDFEISSGMERAAPQRGQLVWPRAMEAPHQEHFPPENWTAGAGSGGGEAYAAGAGCTSAGGCGDVFTLALTGARLTADPQPAQK